MLSVGRLRPPYADDVAHYVKLLSRYARLELIEVRSNELLARRLESLGGDPYVVALDSDGEQLDSMGFSAWLEQRRGSGRDLVFVIGGAFGAGGAVEKIAGSAQRLSVGPWTMAHQLARVVLLEQLYRAQKILAGEPYHH